MLTDYMRLFIYSIPQHQRRHCLEKTRVERDPKTLLIYMSFKTGINIHVNYDTQVRV